MIIRFMSDLHLDPSTFEWLHYDETPTDKDSVLVLAGDVAERNNGVPFAIEAIERFKHVIWVMGNHEYYGSNIKRTPEKIREAITNHFGMLPDNFSLLDPGEVVIDDVVFIGATLWTDMDRDNHWTKYIAKDNMNDYKKIRHGPSSVPYERKLTPTDTISIHYMHRDYIMMRVKEWEDTGKKVVVVTHHSPCPLSVPEQYKGNHLNGAYHSDLSELIYYRDIDLWIHGHIHSHTDYMIHDTRVVANPRGYVTKKMVEETGFDPYRSIAL